MASFLERLQHLYDFERKFLIELFLYDIVDCTSEETVKQHLVLKFQF